MNSQCVNVNLKEFLPKELLHSLLCYSFLNSKVLTDGPDIAICCSNGFLYEVKKKKILGGFNLNCNPSTIQCSYLVENEKLFVFYLVHSEDFKLFFIKRNHKCLKLMKIYEGIKKFQVFDFYSLGYPQVKLFLQNQVEDLFCEFPIVRPVKPEYSENLSPLAKSLFENLQELYKETDEVTEELTQLRKICLSSESFENKKVFVGEINFSSPITTGVKYKLSVSNKWIKVLGRNLILGMLIHNNGSETIENLEATINHKDLTSYILTFFQWNQEFNTSFFSPLTQNFSLEFGEQIQVVGTFEVPKFFSESTLFIPFYVFHPQCEDLLVKEIFQVNVLNVASYSTVGLEDKFTVEDLLAVKVSKIETRVKIKTENVEDDENDLMELILMENLNFKKIKFMKDKLFYCTSSYLNEVFVLLKFVSVKPFVWTLTMYTSIENEIYFLVNALYDLLPENSAILSEEKTEKKI